MKRYDLYRATRRGVLRLELQLGVNEPAGDWKVSVRELLTGKQGEAAFAYRAPVQCGALAGAQRRAVYFARDYRTIFRFFRLRQTLALVVGRGAHIRPQAERLASSLKRWGIECRIVDAASVKKKELPPEAKKTWTGDARPCRRC